MKIKELILATALSLLAACDNGASSSGAGGNYAANILIGTGSVGFEACQDPRARACTREFAPVCGVLQSGQQQTFSNACTACSNPGVTGHSPGACDVPPMMMCELPRPNICTLDYRPVCAQMISGESKTFANACSACADAAVTRYTPGACPAPA